MPDINSLSQRIISVNSLTFDDLALEIFRFQFRHNPIYRSYVQALGKQEHDVTNIYDIPFLPIEFFKTKNVKTGEWNTDCVFESSGTTQSQTSKHYVFDESFYLQNCLRGFETVYGSVKDHTILALLPSYLERSNSGLISMVNYFICESDNDNSGFFLNEWESLNNTLISLRDQEKKTLLIGVTFGLLDFAERFQMEYPALTVMETGGMKGRREEMIRDDVHSVLKSAFGVEKVHSEYGMTELFSQAYSHGEGIFSPSRTMKVISRDLNDPLAYPFKGRNGGLNIIDLANFMTCSFIETKDMGEVFENGNFEVRGRIDNAELRGCNLMMI
ncbi:acyl transferase [Roseivirga sp. E12]|uniref:LuxE/PaaK family acyltransferase n=1 Tax=Roseivirga sp. E12 TaxID=2819237 RepID=UPI001ABCC87D|nr:acyl transferase [Roseivirga sp. E12]MBO3698496.1 acyl transferase [Roseivirga sp. E12]